MSSTFSFSPLGYFACELVPLYKLFDEMYWCWRIPPGSTLVEFEFFELYYLLRFMPVVEVIFGNLLKVLLEAAC